MATQYLTRRQVKLQGFKDLRNYTRFHEFWGELLSFKLEPYQWNLEKSNTCCIDWADVISITETESGYDEYALAVTVRGYYIETWTRSTCSTTSERRNEQRVFRLTTSSISGLTALENMLEAWGDYNNHKIFWDNANWELITTNYDIDVDVDLRE